MDSKFRDSHITGKHLSFEDGAMKVYYICFDVAAPHGRAAESKAMQRTRVSVGSVTTAAAKCVRSDRNHYRIIVSFIAIILIYRIVYRSETVFGIS